MTDELQVRAAQVSLDHDHTSRCYWDLYQCRWVCRPAQPPVESTREGEACISST